MGFTELLMACCRRRTEPKIIGHTDLYNLRRSSEIRNIERKTKSRPYRSIEGKSVSMVNYDNVI